MKVFRKKSLGFTLIEAAVILLLLSIALIPMIKLMSSEKDSADGVLTGTSAGRMLTQEQGIANAIMEKAIAGESGSIMHPVIAFADQAVLGFDADGNFVKLDVDGNYTATVYNPDAENAPPATNITNEISNTANRTFTFPKYRYESTDFYYNWFVIDSTMQEVTPAGTTIPEMQSFMPKGNNLVKAVLNIYSGASADTKATADYSVSTYFFKNTSKSLAEGEQFTDKVGIILVLDLSLSMMLSNESGFVQDSFYDIPGTVSGMMYTNYTDTGPPTGSTGTPLPMRMSSGLSGHDPAAVASPYLVYRGDGINDLYFSHKVDNPLTPYDERYNPCAVANNATYDLPISGATEVDGSIPNAVFSANCTNSTPALPAGRNDIFLYVPSIPEDTVQANLTAGALAGKTWGAPDYAERVAFGEGCLDPGALENSTCSIYSVNGSFEMEAAAGDPTIAMDYVYAQRGVAALLGNRDENITKTYLSRIEAARTALLSFVLSIEGDPGLVNNFVLGFVPYSTTVVNAELEALAGPSGGSFDSLKTKFRRINRACSFATSNYPVGTPACTSGNPITLIGQTNISHALYNAKELFDNYESVNDPLAKKIVVFLTDGRPTASASDATTPTGTVTAAQLPTETANLQAIGDSFYAGDDINFYVIGLLTAGDSGAHDALSAIAKGTGAAVKDGNGLEFVESVGNLTPVFEAIAQQAERFVLEQMQARYSYLEHTQY